MRYINTETEQNDKKRTQQKQHIPLKINQLINYKTIQPQVLNLKKRT
jgi:hypothetical protein